jgi:ABC-type branched-subunit amino acid transport system substrate-binding protein
LATLGAIVACAGATHVLSGQEGQDERKDWTRYAGTPPKLAPFREYQSPYLFFFDERLEYLGPGRDKVPLSGLTEVRLGFIGPIEGSRHARLGRRMLQGATLAVEQANAAGGFNGLPFNLIVRNDLGLWGASSNEIVALHDAGVWGMLGSIDGANTHILLRLALKLDMPMVVTGDTDPTFTETRIPWAIRVNGDDRQSSYALALQIHDVMGYSRVAVLRVNNRYGRVGTAEFKDAMTRLGAPIVLEMRYEPGDTTFAAQLERIRRADPDAILLWGDVEEAGLAARQIREMGIRQPVFGSDRLVSEDFLRIAGRAADGVVATYLYDPTSDDPILRNFNRRYRERFGEEPESFAAHAYDGMNIMIEAVRRAGLNRVRIRDEMTDLTSYSGVTGEIIFDERWDDVGPIWMAEIRDGGFHFFPSPLEQARHENSRP